MRKNNKNNKKLKNEETNLNSSKKTSKDVSCELNQEYKLLESSVDLWEREMEKVCEELDLLDELDIDNLTEEEYEYSCNVLNRLNYLLFKGDIEFEAATNYLNKIEKLQGKEPKNRLKNFNLTPNKIKLNGKTINVWDMRN